MRKQGPDLIGRTFKEEEDSSPHCHAGTRKVVVYKPGRGLPAPRSPTSHLQSCEMRVSAVAATGSVRAAGEPEAHCHLLSVPAFCVSVHLLEQHKCF